MTSLLKKLREIEHVAFLEDLTENYKTLRMIRSLIKKEEKKGKEKPE